MLEALRAARKNNPAHQSAASSRFSEEVLLLRTSRHRTRARGASERFALRFQQLTGPVKAKAVEDTAFYRYNRLVCLNEVGSDPGDSAAASRTFTRRTPSARAPGRWVW